MNFSNLNSFLELGYFLLYDCEEYKVNIENINKNKYSSYSKDELFQIGSELWQKSISDLFETNKKNLVPFSGGLDSRALLAGLLEHTEAKNIHTYTFGVPGALDFEIGNLVAKELGTQHININLDEYTYSTEGLLDVSKRMNCQTLLLYHDPISILDEKFSDYLIWKGFLGETLAGSHLHHNPSQSIDMAIDNFITDNRFVKSIDLKYPGSNYYSLLDFDNNINPNALTYEEQLDLRNRQTKYIAPHVMLNGFEYKLPFCNQALTDFFLSIDNAYRRDQRLYKEMLLSLYPELFSKPTATYSGLSLRSGKTQRFLNRIFNKAKRMVGYKPLKKLNYFDFGQRMKTDKQFYNLIRTNIYELAERKIVDWIDIVKLFKSHVNGEKDYSDALIVLVSLEIHLKNGKQI